MPEHWSDSIETTPEVKTAMGKYNSEADFRTGAANAMKSVGAPYRLPKSLDSLPDDNARDQFHAGVKALQDTVPYDEKGLDDVNYAEGLADATHVSEDAKKALMAFAKEKKLPKSLVQELVQLSNGVSTLQGNARTKASDDKAAITKATIEGLYGGEEGVKKNFELVKRMADQHGGLTTEESESLAGLISSGTKQHAVFTKFLFNLAKKVVPEGSTEGGAAGQPGEKTETEETKEQMPATAGVLGW